MRWEEKNVDEYSKWNKRSFANFNEEQKPLIPMDPQTGKKLQFVGSGTFSNRKMNGDASVPNEKAANGALNAINNDGIPMETMHKTIKKRLQRKRNKWTLIVTFSSLVLIIIFITIAYLVARQSAIERKSADPVCKDSGSCSMTLIETIPNVLKFKGGPRHESISSHWRKLIQSAKHSIDILSMYWTMKSSDVKGGPYPQADIGEQILADLRAAAERGVKIRIVQNAETQNTKELAKLAHFQVRTINMKRLLKAGILHTKFFSVDGKNAYVGSANMDWRALTEVKELGLAMYGCSCSVTDVNKIFETNWMLATDTATIPRRWPQEVHTKFNKDNPIVVQRKDSPVMKLYWAQSPPALCPPWRTSDLEAILDMITKAKKYVYIQLMDYLTAFVYIKPQKYWDVIDRELRAAVFDRGVDVRLMPSRWNTTRQEEIVFLKSLNEFGKMPLKTGRLEVKMFEMPLSPIPYTRVSHSKFMVTENAVFVSTSNWSGDYFNNTGGISVIMDDIDSGKNSTQPSMHSQLKNTFLRDWGSSYAKNMDNI